MPNNLVALGLKPIEIENPVEQYAKVAGVRNMIQQGQIRQQQMQAGALKLQEEQRGLNEQETVRQVLTKAGGDLAKAREMLGTTPGISRDTLTKFDDELDKHTKALAAQKDEDFKQFTNTTGAVHDALTAVASLPPEQQQPVYDARQQQLIDAKLLDPKKARPYAGPEDVNQQLAVSTTAKQLVEQAAERRAAQQAKDAEAEAAHKQRMFPAQEATAATEAEQKARELAGTGPTGIKAAEQARLNFEQKRFDREVDALHETMRHNRQTEGETARFHNLSLEGVQLTPESKDKMAEMFATTGVLPSLGMGQAAGRNRSAIINRAAELYPDVQFATQKAAFQANQQSLKKLQTQSDMTDAFESTAGKNIDVFLNSAKGIIDTGSPLLNSPVRMLSDKVFGSENMAAFKAARETALTEAAKVLESPQGGGALTVSGRDAVKTLSDPSATLKQQVASMKVLRNDMANRKQSNREQIEAITKRLGAPGSEGKPAEGEKVKTWNPATNKFE